MRIQNNISALNTYSVLKKTNSSIASSLQKLSSGYSINKAADNAAGLAISEKMRSQIRGMEQAKRNAADGVNLIQTAEGYMKTTNDILQRMRELAVQAANGTYDTGALGQTVSGSAAIAGDRAKINEEIQQLTDELDRIAETASFNGMKLSNNVFAFQVGANTAEKYISNARYASDGYDLDTLSLSTTPSATGPGRGTGFDAVKVKSGDPMNASVILPTETITHTDASLGTVYVEFGTNSIKTYEFDFSSGSKIPDTEQTFDMTYYKLTAPDSKHDIIITDSSGYGSAICPSSVDLSIEYNGSGLITIKGTSYNSNNTPKVNYQWNYVQGGTSTAYQTNVSNGVVTGPREYHNSQSLVALIYGTEMVALGPQDISNNLPKARNAELITAYIGGFDSVSLGVNASASAAGGIDLTTQAAANESIDIINKAISKVTSYRASLGAVQNRLEYTINNLDTAIENTAASESAIRDTDMADEMMNYTKLSVLSQAASAMMAQANTQSESVLRLLG